MTSAYDTIGIIPGSVIFVKTLHFGVESTFAALYKSGEMV